MVNPHEHQKDVDELAAALLLTPLRSDDNAVSCQWVPEQAGNAELPWQVHDHTTEEGVKRRNVLFACIKSRSTITVAFGILARV